MNPIDRLGLAIADHVTTTKCAWSDEMRDAYDEAAIHAAKLQEQRDELLAAAEAVIARWDTPTWKDAPATAVFIGKLRAAIAKVKGSAA